MVVALANDLLEKAEDQRIELRAPLLTHHRERLLRRKRLSVHTVGGQCVEDVRDRCDAPFERDRLACEPVRVAVSVPALVVRQRDRGCEVEHLRGGAAEQPMADLGVPLHRASFLVGERATFEKDVVGDRDLADVVERACVAQKLTPVLVEAEPSRNLLAHPRHSLGVAAGLGITELGRIREPADGLCLGTA